MPTRREHRRFLATLLFTDIVGSTDVAARVGDREWRQLVEQHHRAVRQQLRLHKGREMDTAGDGFFAVFETPESAVRCAVAISAAVAPFGLEVRAGVHTGECELIGGKAGGMAVNIAARIMSLAGAGQVLVSSSVRDMTVGSGLRFAGGEERSLKGVGDTWRVYELVDPDQSSGAVRVGVRPLATRGPRRELLVGGAAAVVMLMAVTAALVGVGSSGPTVGANAVGVLGPGSTDVSFALPVGQRPAGVAVDDTTVWVSNSTSDSVSRIDRRTRSVTPVKVGSGPQGVAVGAGAVWVANGGDGTVSRILPETNAVDSVPVGAGPFGVAVAAGSVWVTNALDASVSRIDPVSERVRQTVAVGAGPSGIAFGEGSLWVANEGDGTVTRIDPATGAVQVAAIPVGNGPTGIAVGAGAVWVANNTDGSLSRIDPQDLSASATRIAPGGGTFGVAVRGREVWVSNEYAGTLTRVDARSQRITKTISTRGAPLGLAVGGGQLWFTNAGGGSTLHRGGTLRLVGSALSDIVESTAAVVDPFDSYDSSTWRILVVTNDGLVGMRRVGGVQGTLPVADLATSLPAPTDGGRSYAFTLRRGIRYSTGQQVLAGDFRRGLERSLRNRDSPYFLFDVLKGASSCSRGAKAACDLSAGIVTDDEAGTVTFHLTRPDPAFLYKLALPTADALPAGVPEHLSAGQAYPATGPYMIKSYERQQTDAQGRVTKHGRLVLVRNPRFSVWSSAAQPDGYADSIVLETGLTSAESVTEVTAGRADAVWQTPVEELSGLGAARADEVHRHVLPLTNYVFLNTRVPPFNNADARRAVAYALDRGDIAGDPDAVGHGQVACQVLPPDFPGYRPYCPFSLGSDKATWRAPDVRRALQLVTSSGTSGAHVTFYSVDDPAWLKTARRVAATLTELGYPTTVKALGDYPYFDAISDSRNAVQAGLVGWGADYPAASTFLDNLASCSSFRPASRDNTNYGEYCDPKLDSKIRQALERQGEDPGSAVANWASVDRAVTDAAPLVAYSNDVGADLVGRRVGNYQWHLQIGMLLAQLWVQ